MIPLNVKYVDVKTNFIAFINRYFYDTFYEVYSIELIQISLTKEEERDIYSKQKVTVCEFGIDIIINEINRIKY